MTRRPHNRGFTLAELLVASVVGALLAGAAAGGLSILARSRGASLARQEAFSAADGAAAQIQLDALSALRDQEPAFTRIVLEDGGLAPDELMLIIRGIRPVRDPNDVPEGGEYEVHFRVAPAGSTGKNALWRRIDNAFDSEQMGGGIATPFAHGVESLSIEAYDGESWYASWDSDRDGMPHALRVVVTAMSNDGRQRSIARRIIAFDRTPIPWAGTTEDTNNDTGTSETGGSSGGTGGAR